MRVLIIEDEEVLARSLAAKLREIRPDIEIVGHTTSIQESISFLGIYKDIDIIFADIKIDDGLSFVIFDKLDVDAMIVFTTAYDEYALKAFSYNCADYLLKPISKEALEKTIVRCEKRLPHITPSQIKELSRDVKSTEAPGHNWLSWGMTLSRSLLRNTSATRFVLSVTHA